MASSPCRRAPVEKTDELADSVVAVARMPQGKISMHLVTVTAPVTDLCEVARLFELSHDLGCRALGDPDLVGYVPKSQRRVGGDALKDVSVIR